MERPSSPVHPELVWSARLLPRQIPARFLSRTTRWIDRLAMRAPVPSPRGITVSDHVVPESARALRVYRPTSDAPPPVLLWFHGGGFVIGSPRQDERVCIAIARATGVAVAAAAYRLAPEHPFPAAPDDGYAALRWLAAHAAELGLDGSRIAIGGLSAGGGLAAGVAIMARDRGEVRLAHQLLVYPMLDDRTTLRSDIDTTHHRLWSVRANRYGWRSYLGAEPGGSGVSPYAAPSRVASIEGLPPAWIGVGTHDLFLDENTAYARRLEAGGLRCDLEIVEGAFHAFDAFTPRAAVTRAFHASAFASLRRALA